MGESQYSGFETQERTPSQEEFDMYAVAEQIFLSRHLANMNLFPDLNRQPVIDDWMRVYSGAFQIAFSNLVERDPDFVHKCKENMDGSGVLDEIEKEFKKVRKLEGLD